MRVRLSTSSPAIHVRIGAFEARAECLDEVLAFFRETVVPRFLQSEGFLGYQAFFDRARGRLVGISWWATRAVLEASTATAQWALREAEALGATPLGEPQIMEVGFDTLLPK
jgi:quinol monooxygenase YgiN